MGKGEEWGPENSLLFPIAYLFPTNQLSNIGGIMETKEMQPIIMLLLSLERRLKEIQEGHLHYDYARMKC